MAFLGFFDDIGKYIYLVPKETIEGNPNTITGSESKDDVIILSATEEFTTTDTTSVSEFPVSNGSRHTDHYSVNPATVSFRGVISPKLLSAFSATSSLISNGNLDNLKTPVQNYISRIREVMYMAVNNGRRRSPLFFVYLPDGNSLDNCVITSFSLTRDSKVSDGYYVDITVQQVFFAETEYTIVPLNDKVAVASAQTNDTGNYNDDFIAKPIVNNTPLSAR